MEIFKLFEKNAADGTQFKVFFAFENLWPIWAIVLMATAAVSLLYLAYSQKTASLSRLNLTILYSVRLLSITLILICIFKPILITKKESTGFNHLAIVVDTSESMAQKDMEDKETRLNWIQNNFLEKEEGPLHTQLKSKYIIDLFQFAKTSDFLGEIDLISQKKETKKDKEKEEKASKFLTLALKEKIKQLTPTGKRTDFTQAITQVYAFFKEKPLSGVIILSDGIDNSYSDITPLLERFNIPIFTIGIGKITPKIKEKDAELLELNANKYAIKDRLNLINVKLKTTNIKSETLSIHLKKDNEIITTELLKIQDAQEIYDVDLEYIPKETGEQKLTVEISTVEEEKNIINNTKHIFLKILETNNKILYVEGELRWEYKFLKRVLEENENITLVSILLTGKQKATVSGDAAYTFPEDKDELYTYDAIILGSIKRSFFTLQQLNNIYDFVNERGGSLITLGGEKSYGPGEYKDSPLAKILPVVMGGKDDGQINKKFKIQISDEGKKHPIFWLGNDYKKNVEVWENMPELDSMNKVERIKPGAIVIAQNEMRGQIYPVIAAAQFGKGKTLAIMTDTTWRWDFQMFNEDTKETVYTRFWNQIIRWAIIKEESASLKKSKTFVLQAENDEVVLDNVATFRARVLDDNLLLDQSAEIVGELTTPDNKAVPLKFDLAKDEKGIYITSYVPTKEGEYTLSAYNKNDLEKKDADTVVFTVIKSDIELKTVDLNEDLLKKIAGKSGGAYYHYSDKNLNTLSEKIPHEEIKRSQIIEKEIWDNIYTFILFVFLLTFEWLYRRKRELI